MSSRSLGAIDPGGRHFPPGSNVGRDVGVRTTQTGKALNAGQRRENNRKRDFRSLARPVISAGALNGCRELGVSHPPLVDSRTRVLHDC